jgi:L-fuculose-phosphate aldolase
VTVSATAQSVREQVAWACRILALEGFSDLTLGHVSARPAGSETVYIKRKGLALDEVGPDDVVDVDDPSAALHLETVIHTEIYASRPDVGAIVHAHPPYVTAFGATTAELQLLTHDAVLFADGVAYFEETSELITEEEQGRAVAEALGHRRAVILRNHGVVVADADVRWAVLSSITLERAVRLQAIATGLGELRPIARDDAERMRADKYQDHFVDEYWAAWIRSVRRAGADHGMPAE